MTCIAFELEFHKTVGYLPAAYKQTGPRCAAARPDPAAALVGGRLDHPSAHPAPKLRGVRENARPRTGTLGATLPEKIR